MSSSAGRRALEAASGLLLAAFALAYLAGSLLLFKGEPVYNAWMDSIMSNPVTPLLEICLAAVFAAHAAAGIWSRAVNFLKTRARHEARWQGGRTIASATMAYSAAAILAFLVLHLVTVRFADRSMGFYQLVTGAFRQPLFAAASAAGAAALALHLRHGVPSAFLALGLAHPRYDRLVRTGALAAAAAMFLFALIPLYYFFGLDLRSAEAAGQMVIIQ